MPELPYNADPVPATPIGDLPEWHLEIQCGRCWHHGALPLSSLAELHGARLSVLNAVQRLRCGGFVGERRCHGGPKRVFLVKLENRGKNPRRLREIVVLDRSGGP